MSMYRGCEVAWAKKNNNYEVLCDLLGWLFIQEAEVTEINGERYIEEQQVYELLDRFGKDLNGEVEE